jgi:hypothetical protein
MAKFLRQSTASQEIVIGRMVDATDGNTAETGLTIANTDIDIWKHGATTLADKNSGGGSHIAGGIYSAVLDATDTDTPGNLKLFVQVAGALAWEDSYVVLPANVYDSFILGTDLLDINVSQFGGSAGTFASGIPAASLTASAINSVADQVWDEAASGHVTAGSFGQAHNIIRANTAQAGAGTTITLDASASAVDDFYNNARIFLTAGTGVGQGRFIEDYDGTTKVATVATWGTNPSSDSVFVILPFGSIPGASAPTAGEVADAVWDEARADHVTSTSFGALGTTLLRVNTAQAGTASSITLDASASATNDLYNYNQITIISGTGALQSRQISDYNGTSKVATVGVNWTTNPSSDSVFAITPLGVDAATVASIADAVWDEARSGHATAGSFGEYTNADMVRISGDTSAADNAESFFDGTGYAGTNNVIPLVTTTTSVTNQVTANVTGISGDSTAADNLEAALDGTGGVTITAALTGAITGDITGNLSGSVGSVTGAVGSVTAVSAGGITASSFAADAITAAKVAADVGTEIATAVLTAAASAPIEANLKEINDVAVTGDGSVTPFGV